MTVSIPNTTREVLTSESIGENFVIDILKPNVDGPLPVVILTDGNMMFPMVSSTVQLLWAGQDTPRFILVGVGYENHQDALSLRTRDLTPTVDESYLARLADNGNSLPAHVKPGGANAFHEFIEQSVKPLVAADTNGDYTLAGHSLGGLFTLHVMFSDTSCYNRYLAGSPSLWWDERHILNVESEFAERHSLETKLFTSIGGREQTGPNAHWSQMVSNWHTFTERLHSRRYSSLELSTQYFADETHTSVVATTWAFGLRQLFKSS